ncbi:hypothetical protein GCM10007301_53200 [Azorhizobium oxalatiphilum]|uniref:DUF2157 domain-containing protein n=1 Tax=Azorhizobium oxalatiphilum TaxID=980631 RepID=A0A917FKH9_9HYPH|nr:DUF2157 domain-containing protein [Azorhizobium oxalatiphilum]GGF86663.1 hypothetical protein GCM10007301_53200 [Azorhizobium oxalatiphilum]
MSDPHPSSPPSGAKRILISLDDLDAAVVAGVIGRPQADALWAYLGGRPAFAPNGLETPRFSFGHTLYYFGGLLAIAAMTLFMTLSWDVLGPWGIAVLAVLYAIACWIAAETLLKRGLSIPAGLLGALAVCLVPLATWAIQHALGLWPELSGGVSGARYSQYHQWVDARWLTLEVTTLIIGGLMLWRLPLPFMVMPLAVTLWYMSMDFARVGQGQDVWDWDWDHARHVSLLFGIGMCVVAGGLDIYRRRRGTADFSTWLYLFGGIAAWTGLTFSGAGNEFGRLGYALLNAGLVLFGAAIGRRIFTVLGAFGIATYLGYLAFDLFQDSLLFPLALSLLGLGIVAIGIWWQRHEEAIHRRLSAILPSVSRGA